MQAEATPTFREADAQPLFTIGEAAAQLGIAVPTLRLYERQGLLLPLRRASGHRLYATEDIARIRCIRDTIKTKKISIAGIRQMLSLIPCWSIKNCSATDRSGCKAFTRNLGPCWTLTPQGDPCKPSTCRTCPVYASHSDCDTIKSVITHYTTRTLSPPEP